MNVAIIGGGKAAESLLDFFETTKDVSVRAVMDIRPDAPGVRRAQQLGITTVTDLESVLSRTDLNVIIEVTGRSDVRKRVLEAALDKWDVMTAGSTKVMFDLISRAEESKRAADEARKDAENAKQEAQAEAMALAEKNADALARSSTNLLALSQQLRSTANQTADKSGEVLATAQEVTTQIESVSAASEETATVSHQVHDNTRHAAEMAGGAVSIADTANQTMTKLGASSAEISNVVKVITTIAGQTNLLALNAAIEAARAGDAGRGFAVVANEVKVLARETARATDDIGKKIAAIQHDTQAATDSITEITSVIRQMSDISKTIEIVMKEQNAATTESSRSMGDAVANMKDISGNVSAVVTTAKKAATIAAETERSATELAAIARELKDMVDRGKAGKTTGARQFRKEAA